MSAQGRIELLTKASLNQAQREAVLAAAAQIVQLKVDLSGKEKALSEVRVAEINAKAALDKLLLEKGGEKTAEAALLGSYTRSRSNLLSIRVGNAQTIDATANLSQPVEAPESRSQKEDAKRGKTSSGSPGKR